MSALHRNALLDDEPGCLSCNGPVGAEGDDYCPACIANGDAARTSEGIARMADMRAIARPFIHVIEIFENAAKAKVGGTR